MGINWIFIILAIVCATNLDQIDRAARASRGVRAVLWLCCIGLLAATMLTVGTALSLFG